MKPSGIITLLTDFGLVDPYVAMRDFYIKYRRNKLNQ